MRTEFANIAAAFNLLPTLAGNGGLVVAVNLGGTALTVVPGSTITTTGAFTTIFAQAASVTLNLPTVNGTLALLASPAFTGTPTAPTAGGGTNTTQIATTAFVTAAVGAGGVVSSVAGRTGAVVLTNADISGSAPLASPALTGVPTAPTASGGTNTTQLATTAFVTAAVGSGGVVSSVAGRTGAVVLAVADVSGAAPLASPALTGNPTAPTATAGDNDTSIATTAFVQTMPAAPPPIGSTTPNTGAFTTLAASSTVSGAGFTARLATPGPIGNTSASTGAFTTLAASSTVSGTGFDAYLASGKPGSFSTLAASSTVSGAGFDAYLASGKPGAFSTLSASSTVSGAGFTAWAASPPAIGGSAPNTGNFTTLTAASMVLSGGAGAPVTNAGVLSQFATTFGNSATVTYSLDAANSVIAFQFWAISDARAKTDIKDISARDGVDWIMRGRPVTYKKNGQPGAGFIAQDEIRSGRGASVSMVEDKTMEEGDEHSPPGIRLVKSYEHEIAYLTAALQGALKRLTALEDAQ